MENSQSFFCAFDGVLKPRIGIRYPRAEIGNHAAEGCGGCKNQM